MTPTTIQIELDCIIQRMSHGCNVQSCCISPGKIKGRCICRPRELRMQFESLRLALENISEWREDAEPDIELRTCPFCGVVPALRYGRVRCTNNECDVQPKTIHVGSDAIDQWNNRG